MMRGRWVGLVVCILALQLVPGGAIASHDRTALPLLEGDGSVDRALDWMAGNVTQDGCVETYHDIKETWVCRPSFTKKYAIAVAHAGVDPGSWPSGKSSLADWMESHTMWDKEARGDDCDCPQKRVLSVTKSILAWTAADRSPRDVPRPDGSSRDLVADLLDQFDGQQFGSNLFVNDDIWAIFALNAAGYDGSEVDSAVDFVTSSQRANGGVGHSHSSTEASVDMTAWAIQAIAPHEASLFLDRARGYLVDAQLTSGEGEACWPLRPSNSPPKATAESTAAAALAIVALQEDPLEWSVGEQSPLDCLLEFQKGSGGFQHHRDESTDSIATWQALTGLSWLPLGAALEPNGEETISQTTHEGEETHTSLPNGFLRVGQDSKDSVTWTPSEPGTRVFHGFRWTPVPHRVNLTAHVLPAEDDGTEDTDPGGDDGDESDGPGDEQDSEDSSGDEDEGQAPDDGGEEDSPAPPTVQLPGEHGAERNVTLELTVDAEPGDAPIEAYHVDWGDGSDSGWQENASFNHTYRTLGNMTLEAHARDTNGTVSPAAQTNVSVEDARPTIALQGPAYVNRTETVELTAEATDPDGPTPAVHWELPDGQANGTSVTIAFDEPGPHEVTALARDEAGNTARERLTIHAVNRPPIDLDVTPLTVDANTTVTLRPTATDPDGDPLTYTWQVGDTTASASTLWLRTGSPGNRTLGLNVTDPYDGWTRAEVRLRILANGTTETPPGNLSLAGSSETSSVSNATTNHTTLPAEGATDPDIPRAELPERIRGIAGARTLVQGTASQRADNVTRVEVRLTNGTAVETEGTEDFTAILPARSAGTYAVQARLGNAEAWGPWTNTTLVVEPARDEPLEAAAGPSADASLEVPGLTVPLTALLVAGAARSRRLRR